MKGKIMAPKASTPVESTKGKQLQATVPQDVWDAFDEHHWEKRTDLVDIVRTALVEYGQRQGFLNEEGKPNPKP
jgi:hypothetical protein